MTQSVVVYSVAETRSLLEGEVPEHDWVASMGQLAVGESFGCDRPEALSRAALYDIMDAGHFPGLMFHIAMTPTGVALLVRDR